MTWRLGKTDSVVEFITLFLGALVAGPTEVRFQVSQEVAALEIRLDAEPVATLIESPWALEVDFGERLAPHLLEAVGYAADGREIGKASQWTNLSPKHSELTIALDRDRRRHRVEARVHWQSLAADNRPIRASAFFDGQALEVRDPKSIPLPPHDPDRVHHLRVELEFPGSLRSAAEVTFGGRYGEEVSTELTAFPVAVAPGRDLPAVDMMQDWFTSSGRPLRVQAAERGPAEIVVVRSPSARQRLIHLSSRREARATFPILRDDHRLRFVGASPALVVRNQSPFVVFPRSEEIGVRVGGLLKTLVSIGVADDHPGEVRLSDAVAVAGLFANRSARRRAIVLITTAESSDASQFGPEQVRGYLESIGVPLVVWNPETGKKEAGGWGAALNISTDSLLDHAYKELSRSLDRQRIVWLGGLHLPQTIVLDPEIEGVEPLR